MNGILNLYKPNGVTSHDCVAKVRRLYCTRRVGHAGTLDPFATGVLPVLIGSATAVQDDCMGHGKVYRAGMRFGIWTDTGDMTGKILGTAPMVPSEQDVLSATKAFVGEIEQIPPMYSAVKVGGRKLYEYARSGLAVERKARKVTITSFALVRKESETDYVFDIGCSKGTYLRSLCMDLGQALGCGGTLYSLERLACGEFHIQDAVTFEALEQAQRDSGQQGLESFLMPVEHFLQHLPEIRLSPFYERLAKNGAEIYLDRAKIDRRLFDEQPFCRMTGSDGALFALGECRMFAVPSGGVSPAIKAVKRFDTGS